MTVTSSRIAEVAIPLPIATCAFSYRIPDELIARTIPGVRVIVPFRNREITGYVVAVDEQGQPQGHGPQQKKIPDLKAVISVLDDQPVLSATMLALTRWVSDYYACSWGEAIENALPRWVKYGKKTEKYFEKAKSKKTDSKETPVEYSLNVEQQTAFNFIQDILSKKNASVDPVLLYGVTGSGKSELYIRAIKETLKNGRGAICLVPEIALTEQLKRFFAGHFGDELEILHSKMTDGERFLAWKRIELKLARVVLGPRSAVFAPVAELGLIVMDEEHEGSYKQETAPRYHAREVAAWRAKNEKALFLMGTATPSLESMHAASSGRFKRLDLTQRIDQKALPEVAVIDLKRYEGEKRASLIFSPLLMKEIEKNLTANEGTMLLLNRRGFSTSIRCRECGETEKCKSCQVSMTYHQEAGLLLCHYCNYQKKVPEKCPSCQAPILKFMGFGTEKVESEVAKFFPQARVARLDADTTQKKESHERILADFRERKIDILIGTQMIAKGFDFPQVTLVGVVLADIGLRLPDFRSSERTFQLLTQFAGRAGRGHKPGRVLIQTYLPDHPSIRFAKKHDYLNFYDHETKFREEFNYPPFFSLVNIIVRSRTEKKAYVFAKEVRDTLRSLIDKKNGTKIPEGIEIIGPAPLPFYKLRGHFRWHVMLKIPARKVAYSNALEMQKIMTGLKKPSAVSFAVDVEPLNIL